MGTPSFIGDGARCTNGSIPERCRQILDQFEVLGRLFALAEAYPDLKANRNMMQLSEELTTTENKVAFARQAFNDAVMGYNNRREVFPNSVIAGMFNFQAAQLLEIESPVKREVPKVSFT